MKRTEKCWSVDLSKIKEGYCYSEQSIYAENRNKAKSLYSGSDAYVNYSHSMFSNCEEMIA